MQAICDFVNRHIAFDYQSARATRTAYEAYEERVGVCRDFAHLAVAFCRCMNIPARYCNGYLGDIGVPPDPAPMDFNAWFDVFLGGRWLTFDARHNMPRIGRILIARGRDAADIPLVNSFGPHVLKSFSRRDRGDAFRDVGLIRDGLALNRRRRAATRAPRGTRQGAVSVRPRARAGRSPDCLSDSAVKLRRVPGGP